MQKTLVIVESPAKAKTIGQYLGRGYKIEASMGHVRDLPKSTMGIEVEKDFLPKYINIRGKGDIISKLKKEAATADSILLATDPDREGEAISWHLANIFNISDNEQCRISFNEITKNAVRSSIKSPRKIDMNLVDAQQARRVLDRIVGYRISPLLWKSIRKGLSAGRVQSVATKLICDKEEEILKFVSQEYWKIIASLKKNGQSQVFEAKYYGVGNEKGDLNDRASVDSVLALIENGTYKVMKVKKAEKKKSPPPPLTTSTMQQEASRRLGFTAKKTMMVAQQLYEGLAVKGSGLVGLVTYIRTDSMRISADALQEARNIIPERFGKNYLPESARIYKNRSSSQDAHEAIRPTHMSLEPDQIKDSLNNDQYKLYRLIYERFLASQMANAVYDTVTVDIGVSGHVFKANGSTVKFPGFMALYKEVREEREEENGEELSDIPSLDEGEVLVLKKMEPKQFFTQPPLRFTEATLVRALEEKGIGRPSTYAPTIATILDRGYVEKDKKFLCPTELGKVVNEIMSKHFTDIVDVQFTAEMEKQLDLIEEGSKQWADIVREFYADFSKDIGEAEKQIGKIKLPEEETDIPCDKCGRKMVIKIGRFGKFLACPGFPECRNARPLLEDAGVVCPKCGKKVVYKKAKNKMKYLVCEDNPKCGFISWDKPAGKDCPTCGSFLVRKFKGRKPIIKCSNESCNYASGGVKTPEQATGTN